MDIDTNTTEESRPKRKRRWPKYLLVGLLALGALVFFAPRLAAPWARGKVAQSLADPFGGKASVGALRVDWGGSAAIEDVELLDAAGAKMVHIDRLTAQVEPWKAVRKTYIAKAHLEGFEVHVREDENGGWNWQPKKSDSGKPKGESTAEDTTGEALDLQAEFTWADGSVWLHNQNGELGLVQWEGRAHWPGGGLPGTIRASVSLPQKDGAPVKAIEIEGALLPKEGGMEVQDLVATLGLSLERLQADLKPFFALDELQLKGQLQGTVHLQGMHPSWTTRGDFAITSLDLDATLGDEGDSLHLQEPDVQLAWDAGVDLDTRSLQVKKVALQSATLWGSASASGRPTQTTAAADNVGAEALAESFVLEELKGHWSYVPERLGQLLGPWLPGKLEGAEPRDLDLAFSGKLADFDPWDILNGVQGKATIGLGQYTNVGFVTSGSLELEQSGPALLANGNLTANGGELTLQSSWQLPPKEGAPVDAKEVPSSMRMQLSGMQTNPKVGQILALVHPAFQALDASKTGAVSGLLSAQLDLTYAGAVAPEWLQGQFDAVEWNRVEGSGSIQIGEASFSSSPLIQEVMKLLGKPASTPIHLKPLEFKIQSGRLQYDHPWAWTVEGANTSFAGSVGLDQTLDLLWQVPITEALIKKHKVLKPLIGESIKLPIRGSITSPKIDVTGALQAMAERALQKELENRVGDVEDQVQDALKREIDKVLGTGPKPGSKDTGGATNDPQVLLDRADKLYGEGKKAEAKAIYETLRSKHNLTLVYQLNKSRIKRRARE